jgi:nitrite reductase (NO-forming)
MTKQITFAFLMGLLLLVITGCKPQFAQAMPKDLAGNKPDHDIEFRLRTEVIDGKIVFVGANGEIENVINPYLVVKTGDRILVSLTNGDGIPHDLFFPDFNAKSAVVSSKGKTKQISFTIDEDRTGSYPYFCSMAGHRQAGQEGWLIVERP